MGSLGLKKEQQQMVITLLAGAVLVVLSQTLLSPALPSIMNHLQVNATTVQWLTSAYALTEAVVIPLAAWFMGRFSTRTLFIGGMALFGIGSLVAALAPVFSVLLIGRILQAMATGVLMAMVIALILLSFPRESRGAAMGIVGLVIGFAPAIGPTVGGFLVDVIGWRALFAVIVVLTAVVILLALKFLKNYEGFPALSSIPHPSRSLRLAWRRCFTGFPHSHPALMSKYALRLSCSAACSSGCSCAVNSNWTNPSYAWKS